MNKEQVTIEQTKKLYELLQGKIPEGWVLPDAVKLTPKQAGTIIYYLQEEMRIIPDNYEQCDECGEYFDSYSEGIHGDFGAACEACRDNYFSCEMCDIDHKNPETADKKHFVLSPEDAENQDMKPGLYRGKEFPIYSSDMFTQSIFKFNVELVKETTEFLETGFICEECVEKLLK